MVRDINKDVKVEFFNYG